ncbi:MULTISPECIES: glycoside hydrolase family 27 protein [unclassified Crossiella]|uniref:alpha-galactosidase D n=1 Tax=unclassified Crossiella TaxID=2620835 RepID=UPI001FFFB88F|nr:MULTISPECIES: glycoside hydrolase family 27 protein [unclassified Crossiella]MCK2238358.1 glycoside hydrolase family 27 protein [Crossiella sp. S99.2]MCK2256398.1 glycoside hydrolase family 27 protein [Crossiella sp. S99.1]
MRSLPRILLALGLVASGLGAAAQAAPAAQAPVVQQETQSADAQAAPAVRPYLGWSSWSLQTTSYPGVNPKGRASFLTEANVLKQAEVLARDLKQYGYNYLNIDAGWWHTWGWVPQFDEYGRPKADQEKFPRGIKWLSEQLHRKGLKFGLYQPVGLQKEAFGLDQANRKNFPVQGAPGCTGNDIVYPDWRTTNGWDNAYKIDFDKPCAQKYIDSITRMFGDWQVDFFKLDGVGPGSWKEGPNYDNRPDVAAWRKGLDKTGRKIILEISWSIDIKAIDFWKEHATGWRINTDVECYCPTLVTWQNSVDDRFADLPQWIQHAKPGQWNDLDTLNVGNGVMDGLTPDERRSYMTLWSITNAPLYIGDDLTQLDSFGKSLLTNREVLAINQNGMPAKPVRTGVDQQVWSVKNADGSHTVALFNLGAAKAPVDAVFAELGITGPAQVRDVWAGASMGAYQHGFTAEVPTHGTRLLKITPGGQPTGVEAEATDSVLAGGAKLADCAGCSGGRKVGDLGNGSVTLNGITVPRAGDYTVRVGYVSGDPRTFAVGVNGAANINFDLPPTGGWGTPGVAEIVVKLKAGTNSLKFSNPGNYAPDLDRIEVVK